MHGPRLSEFLLPLHVHPLARQALSDLLGHPLAGLGKPCALQGYSDWSTREHYRDRSVKALGDLLADSEPSEMSKSCVDGQLDRIEYR